MDEDRSPPIAALMSLITSLPDIQSRLEQARISVDRSAGESRRRHDEMLSLVRSSSAKVSSLEKRVDGIERQLHHVSETCDAILAMCQSASTEDEEMSSDEDGHEPEGDHEDRAEQEDEGMEEDQNRQGTGARNKRKRGPSDTGQGALGGLQASSGLLSAFRDFLATRRAQGEGQESGNAQGSSNPASPRTPAPQTGKELNGVLLSALAQSLSPAQLISNANGNALHDTRRNTRRNTNREREANERVDPERDYSGYRLDRKIRTVHLLWKEWFEGLDEDKPSVVTMDALYAHTWRSTPRERKYYAHRKVIIDEIHAIMKQKNWTSKTAVDFLDGVMGRNSLLRLSDALKRRKKLGYPAGQLASPGKIIFTQLDEERLDGVNEGDEDDEETGEEEAENAC